MNPLMLSRLIGLSHAFSLGLLLLAPFTPIATAEAEPAPELLKFAGSYKFSGTKEEFFAITDKAREEGLAQLNLVIRMIVKKQMESAPKVFVDTIAIDLAGERIGIKSGKRDKIAPEPGKSETIKREGKPVAKVSHKFDKGQIVQTITGEDKGSTVTTFALGDDGKTLTLNVTTSHPQMQKPVTCQLKYIRQ